MTVESLPALYDKRERLESWAKASVSAGWRFRLCYGALIVYFATTGSGLQMAYTMAGAAAAVWCLVILRCVLMVRLSRIDRTIARRELDALEDA